jgi:hypothetical protein
MNLEDFYCDMFDLSFRFSAEDFDKAAFLREIGVADESEYIDEDGDLVLHVSLPSREETSKQHAHLSIIVKADMTGRADLDFHQPGTKTVENKPPYLEDSAQWIAPFFKLEEVAVRMDVAYEFDKTFSPLIPLPFPLVASSKALSGLKVTGLALDYPADSRIKNAILQLEKRGPYLFVHKDSTINLKEFDLYKELENLQTTVDSLVRKRESTDADNQETSET